MNVQRDSEEQPRNSVWTNMSTPTHTQRINPSYLAIHGLETRVKRSSGRSRSLSQSTIDATSTMHGLESGAVKVVIDRAGSISKLSSNQRISLPTLEVPIPHYRLGEPRFSARGTAFLSNSVYTRSSTNEDMSSSAFSGAEHDRFFPVPSGIESRPVLSRRHSHTSPQPYAVHITSTGEGSTDPVPAPPVIIHQRKEPIVPAMYDGLASNPDNPAFVRYTPFTKDIIAASPARLVAQVTSENFLDYELLSDFFLTVRAYLSTRDLLSYLVARFEWAINRFDDNGRVIRVRAFAALRHWILNYFSYDFLLDRDLRVQFCDRLNGLTRIVRGRHSYGKSDMKLISDLKKCWNGRCILYWDTPEATDDSQQDLDIHPGGISGSRDSQLTHPSQLQPKAVGVEVSQHKQSSRPGEPAPNLEDRVEIALDVGNRNVQPNIRHPSMAAVLSLPTSPISEQSIQALSCSIPAKGFKKMMTHTSRVPENHPPSSASDGHRLCPVAPSATANERVVQSNNGHNRSGSFSDAARDNRASLSSVRNAALEVPVHSMNPYLGSLIRGNLVLPAQPYVRVYAPTTPAMEVPNVSFSSLDSEDAIYDSRRLGVPNTPGVKNILGSIRRALSRKYSGSNGSANVIAGELSAPSTNVGNNSSTPLNLVYQAGSDSPAGSSTANVRVDLLAADVSEAFRQATMQASQENLLHLSRMGIALGTERDFLEGEYAERDRIRRDHPEKLYSEKDHLTLPEQPASRGSLRPTNFQSNHSEVTNGSRSILIVDDTGANLPQLPIVPGGFNTEQAFNKEQQESSRPLAPSSSADPIIHNFLLAKNTIGDQQTSDNVPSSLLTDTQTQSDHDRRLAMTQRSTSLDTRMERPKLSAARRGSSYKSNKSGSISLRRYASFQSTFTKHVRENSIDAVPTADSSPGPPKDAFDGPTRMLRRRPGGDLRANENVHDLEQLPRSRSTGSVTTCTDSTRGSGLRRTSNRPMRNLSSHKSAGALSTRGLERNTMKMQKSPSLVHTHSSQPALRRPSFEAAVAEFARIPDDDEGGIEATLLKLEGRYQRSPFQGETSPSPVAHNSTQTGSRSENRIEVTRSLGDQFHREVPRNEFANSTMPKSQNENPSQIELRSLTREVSQSLKNTQGIRNAGPSLRYAESEDSYNSTPLLERGPSGRSAKGILGTTPRTVSIPRPLFAGNQLPINERVLENDSIRRLRHGSYAPTATTDSFLLDDDESLSDLSSDLSFDEDDRDAIAAEDLIVPIGNPQETMLLNLEYHPPSPPMTMENVLSITSQANQAQEQRKPPTPDPSPVSQHVEPELPRQWGRGMNPAQESIQNSLHLPFVLGYDSELLAQQFTIIEKDALNEIDWRDLVDLRWNNSSPQVTNWVEYLRNNDPRGIDLVSARFNLVVKWVLSEIVLTRNIEERALSIMKYIHIAQQARKIHNYATLFQLTLALTSIDCKKLTRTWNMIPMAEKKIVEDLDSLVNPHRNFYNLRLEIEKANLEQGCIPFVGKC